MRPDPQHQKSAPESGRIIYIGDVRKRRGRKRQTPDRYYLASFILVSLLCWAGWLTVVMTLAPARLLTYIAFFLPLSGALISTGAVILYAVDWYRGVTPSLRVCARRAVLVTSVLVINLACLGARLWLLPIAGVTIAAAVIAEALIQKREP